ncbi:MAG TPA: NAD(P)-dependent oxidoreductase [Terriglobales bacterium]|nr:NAD(P)-dependent oxidoreductase [Terriglobales bacterium]
MNQDAKTKPRVALLGLGTMGSGMAGRLLAAKFEITVFNRTREKAMAFAKDGANVAASPREAAKAAEVIISMVADDAASREVWLGADGALEGARAGSLLIECSTLTVKWVRELAAAVTEHGCDLVDAPVTGSKPQAASGQLLFLAGGPSAAVERARPVLAAMGRGVVHLGSNGTGALLKLVNNFLGGVQTASTAEALAWLQAAGLDRAKAMAILCDGAPGSPIVRRTAERAESNDFTPAFFLRLMAKDMAYAIAEASRAGVDLRTAAPALARFEDAKRQGLGEEDFAAVALSVSEHAGAKP